MSEHTRGRTVAHKQLEDLEQELRTRIALLDHQERSERNARRGADGATWRRLAAEVLAPARLERAVPVTGFAAANVPDPELLQTNWLREVYACPADSVSLSGALEVHVRMLQRAGDELQLLAALLDTKPAKTRYFATAYLPVLAAIGTPSVGAGKEFVPTGLSGRMIERIGVAAELVELFDVQPMPTNPYLLPGFAVVPGRAKLHLQQTANTGQTAIAKVTPGTRDVNLNVIAALGATVLISTELIEDAVVPLLGAIETELGDWLAAGVDDAIINGDLATTHMDSDVVASDDARKAWDGLRKLASANPATDVSNEFLTAAALRANRISLGRAGAVAKQLVHIVSPAGVAALSWDHGFATPERYAGNVQPLPGEQGRVDGVPVVVSDYVRDDLNASGVYDGTTTNRSVALTVNRRGFVAGQRRGITLETLDSPYSEDDQRAVKATMRLAFASRQPAGDEPVALLFNVRTGS